MLFVLFFAGGCSDRAASGEGAGVPRIQIGWQVPWATQGQVVQVLKHTNLLELNGVKAEFKGFSYGAPLNEAALAGEVDLIFTADQPAAMLLARGAEWTIVARLMYNRVAVYVPPGSAIRSLADLRGKTIAMPFGAAAQREALRAIEAAGVEAGEIKPVNLDIYEQTGVIRGGNRGSWGSIDAMVGFDPTPAFLEREGLARMLHVGTVVSLVLVDSRLLERDPDAVQRFLQAFIQAWHYYATHQEQANAWFLQESRLPFDPGVLALCASVEPNIRARSPAQIRPTLAETDLAVVQQAADFVYAHGLAPRRVNVRNHVDERFVRQAIHALATRPRTGDPTRAEK